MIKEIKTDKFEGLAVLVPDGCNYAGANNNELFYWTETCKQRMGDYPHSVHVPNVLNYGFLGKSNELTEEECSEIADERPRFAGRSFRRHFNALMRKLECNTGTWLILKKL